VKFSREVLDEANISFMWR